ncbi:ABC transporter ATP-binding protein [Nitrospirillum viridazoti]|uniref:Peptide/nickel transport system ATP-binding protein n=2 Tax=Nitrospirillum TaxID=1543705 RepID=A0A560HVF7_9PROT|nr:ABC transporter ATP-binding protein [Nitrospirillum amazonense]TWB50612.1 peptide/nickel transport system ATP-binding protein [Nitrospirillum amazonense]
MGAAQDHVQVSGLRITAPAAGGQETPIVSDVDFTIPRGQVLALIGESGSGKTSIALALMGYARGSCRIAGGGVRVGDTEILTLDASQLRTVRGNRIAYVAQSAASAFNPSRTIMDQVVEAAVGRGLISRPAAEAKALGLFRALALPQPEAIGARYVHQLSGGQLQRLMAAMALMTDPELVILDEPTTALDVTTQIDVLRAFKRVVRQQGATALYVSHDLAVVAQVADRIVVLQQGRVREAGDASQVLERPADIYTRTLMAAARPPAQAGPQRPAPQQAPPLLEVRGLTAGYGRVEAGVPKIPVLRDVTLSIAKGTTLGVIGESGSGKSTLARVIAGLVAPAGGQVLFQGQPLAPTLSGRTREQFQRIQLVFQNADTALNPAHTVSRILGRPLAFYHGMDGRARNRRVAELLDLTQLPASLADRHCGELSGGQKQRVNLARALAADPYLILCDEVTSALDTVVGAAILDLLAELRRELDLSYLFISHDISTVRAICDDIAVLYAGQKVEMGPRNGFGDAPVHPYTDLLIGSVPEMRRGWLEEKETAAAPPPLAAAQGANLCRFLPRCAARVEGLCDRLPPPRIALDGGNELLCHHDGQALQHLQRGRQSAAGP